jgi:hypothetical protein
MSLKNPVTPPGIDPGTVRLVAQRFNHYATPGPRFFFAVEAELFHANGRPDRHDEYNSRFSHFLRTRPKKKDKKKTNQ